MSEPTPQPPQQEMAAIRQSFLDVSDIEFTPEEDKRLKALLYQARDAEQAGDLQTCLKCLREYKQGLYVIIEDREKGKEKDFELDLSKYDRHNEPVLLNGDIFVVAKRDGIHVLIDQHGAEVSAEYENISYHSQSGGHAFFQVEFKGKEFFINETGEGFGGELEYDRATEIIYHDGQTHFIAEKNMGYRVVSVTETGDKMETSFAGTIKELAIVDGDVCYARRIPKRNDTKTWAVVNVFGGELTDDYYDIGAVREIGGKLVFSAVSERISKKEELAPGRMHEVEYETWGVYEKDDNDEEEIQIGESVVNNILEKDCQIGAPIEVDGKILYLVYINENGNATKHWVDHLGRESKKHEDVKTPIKSHDGLVFVAADFDEDSSYCERLAMFSGIVGDTKYITIEDLHLEHGMIKMIAQTEAGFVIATTNTAISPAFSGIDKPIPVGDNFAYIAAKGGKEFIIDSIGNKRSPEFEEIYHFVPLPEENGYVIAKEDGKIIKKVFKYIAPEEDDE